MESQSWAGVGEGSPAVCRVCGAEVRGKAGRAASGRGPGPALSSLVIRPCGPCRAQTWGALSSPVLMRGCDLWGSEGAWGGKGSLQYWIISMPLSLKEWARVAKSSYKRGEVQRRVLRAMALGECPSFLRALQTCLVGANLPEVHFAILFFNQDGAPLVGILISKVVL